ncbi:MAG: class I SAM-dependent methyltransferase [Putridiphycobacter sp.]
MEKEIIKTEFGFFTLKNKPTEIELKEYYENKYFQDSKGAYEIDYSVEEIKYFKNKLKEKYFIIEELTVNTQNKRFIDIGCGEGWALDFFKTKGWDVLGLDYSEFGINKQNEHCLNDFVKGDIYENIDSLINKGEIFDVVYLGHVFEHLLDPILMLNKIKKIISPKGILVINVPNDFSKFQEYLFKNNKVSRQYWISIPDHISYFNRKSLKNFLLANDYDELKAISDFSIDLNLLNTNTNYIDNKDVGKSCYFQKIEFENFLHETNPISQIVEFYSKQIDLGMGRSFTGFYSLNK